MSIYTRTGDRGETDLIGGVRVRKDDALLEVCGTLDELNAWLGLARCEALPDDVDGLIEQIQHRLFAIGANLATGRSDSAATSELDLGDLEKIIDSWEVRLGATNSFILPSGCRAAAVLHLARAVCRRAERRLVTLSGSRPQAVSPIHLAYCNRLSDLLFILARAANHKAGLSDVSC